MTNGEKQLLLKDLCARLPYEVQVYVERDKYAQATLLGVNTKQFSITFGGSNWSSDFDIEGHHIEQYKQRVKPYLRPMKSMTSKEESELCNILGCDCINVEYTYFKWTVGGSCDKDDMNIDIETFGIVVEWLNSHYLDYRGLIEMGLALEAPQDMYNKMEE